MSTQPESLVIEKHPDGDLYEDTQEAVAAAPEAPVIKEAPVESTEVPTPAADEFIQIRRQDLHKEISRLEREDKDFANAFNTAVGRKAARQYQARLEELEAERESTQKVFRRAELLALPADEVNRRFKSDPAFAKEYSELVHYDPQEAAAIIADIRTRADVDNILFLGVENGLPEARVEEYREAVKSGKYDSTGSRAAALLALQRDVLEEASRGTAPAITAPVEAAPVATPPAPVAQTPPASPPNPALTSGPDMSPAGSPSPRGEKRYTGTQIRNMSVDEFDSEFTEIEYQRAVADGRIEWDK